VTSRGRQTAAWHDANAAAGGGRGRGAGDTGAAPVRVGAAVSALDEDGVWRAGVLVSFNARTQNLTTVVCREAPGDAGPFWALEFPATAEGAAWRYAAGGNGSKGVGAAARPAAAEEKRAKPAAPRKAGAGLGAAPAAAAAAATAATAATALEVGMWVEAKADGRWVRGRVQAIARNGRFRVDHAEGGRDAWRADYQLSEEGAAWRVARAGGGAGGGAEVLAPGARVEVLVGGGTEFQRWVASRVVRVRRATGCFTVDPEAPTDAPFLRETYDADRFAQDWRWAPPLPDPTAAPLAGGGAAKHPAAAAVSKAAAGKAAGTQGAGKAAGAGAGVSMYFDEKEGGAPDGDGALDLMAMSGMAVEIKVESSNGRRKWLPTAVKAVKSRKQAFFRVELDFEERDEDAERFFPDEMAKPRPAPPARPLAPPSCGCGAAGEGWTMRARRAGG
jgi:hypothetical protein